MTIVPVSALRSAERCPVNLALAGSRRPMALPTRVDAAIPAYPSKLFKWRGSIEWKTERGGRAEVSYVMRHAQTGKRGKCRTDAERDSIQDFE